MREVRRVANNESDAFLRLLCDTFNIDYSRAHIYFSQSSFTDLQRKWALFDGGEMLSILTTVPLQFGWGRAIGIAGVATIETRRNEGLATALLSQVIAQAQANGYEGAYLFATKVEMYAKMGFEVIDQVVRFEVCASEQRRPAKSLTDAEVRVLYDQWASDHPDRLIRDDRRWKYWKLGNRVCSPLDGGYYCLESGTVREFVGQPGYAKWPIPTGTQWVGLNSMSTQFEVPNCSGGQVDLMLMSLGTQRVPQMFMTDQF